MVMVGYVVGCVLMVGDEGGVFLYVLWGVVRVGHWVWGVAMVGYGVRGVVL